MNKNYEINVISDENFENLVAEVIFKENDFAFIVSQERSFTEYEISIYSFIENAKERFYNTEKIPGLMIDFEIFQLAINEAKNRLALLDLPR
jgi:hypothetical protein